MIVSRITNPDFFNCGQVMFIGEYAPQFFGDASKLPNVWTIVETTHSKSIIVPDNTGGSFPVMIKKNRTWWNGIHGVQAVEKKDAVKAFKVLFKDLDESALTCIDIAQLNAVEDTVTPGRWLSYDPTK